MNEEHSCIERDTIRRIYRNVLTNAFRDLGIGGLEEREEVAEWVESESFLFCCDLADWDREWLTELFVSVVMLPESLRDKIARDCIAALRVVSSMKHEPSGGVCLEELHSAANATTTEYVHTDDQTFKYRGNN